MEDTDKALEELLDMLEVVEAVDEPAEAVYCTSPVAAAADNTHCA